MYLKPNAGSRLYASGIFYEFSYLYKTLTIILNQNSLTIRNSFAHVCDCHL